MIMKKVAEIKIENDKIIVSGRKDIIKKMKKNLSSILIEEKWIPNKKLKK